MFSGLLTGRATRTKLIPLELFGKEKKVWACCSYGDKPHFIIQNTELRDEAMETLIKRLIDDDVQKAKSL